MQKILGLDISSTAVKALALEASFRTHELRAWRVEPLGPAVDPEGEPASFADRLRPALEALTEDDWLRADVVVCALPGSKVATHLVTLPFSDARKIEQTLPFEVEGLIPFDLDDVVFDHHVVEKGPGKADLLVAVARKDDVRETLEALAEVGVDPEIVTFSAVGLQALYGEGYLVPGHVPSEDEDGEEDPALEAIVDVGAARTDMLLAEEGQIRFARTFSIGGDDVSRAIARATGLTPELAEEAKKELDLSGGGGDPTARVAAERACAGLLRELRATLSAHAARTRRKVDRVYLAGGGSRLGGLAGYLEQALGVPVSALKLAEDRSLPEEDVLPEATVALALALRGMHGRHVSRLDFRRGEFAFTRAAGELRGRIGALAAMAAILVVLLGVSAWAKLGALEAREQKLDDQLCEVTRKILGKCETDYKVALGRLKGRGSPAASVPEISAVDVVHTVSLVFPEDDAAVITDLDVVEETVRLRGDAKSFEDVEELVEKFNGHACFGDVKKGRLVKDNKSGRVDFDLDARYVCGRGGRARGS